jgi:(p)ppGpp synthase/HD superfamily hydrolase
MNLLDTMDFARAAHGDQLDKAGAPYWLHPVRVMRGLGPDATLATRQVALLHDVLEDTHLTAADLAAAGFPPDVIGAVKLLTRDKTAGTYADYVAGIATSGNAMAIAVKIADLTDNLGRPGAPPTLVPRYRKALALLTKENGT